MIENAEDFQSAVDEFELWLPRVSSVVQQLGPISSVPGEIKKQLKEAEASLANHLTFVTCLKVSSLLENYCTLCSAVLCCAVHLSIGKDTCRAPLVKMFPSRSSNKTTFADVLLVSHAVFWKDCMTR